jgi:hypothetical protein
MIFGLRPWQGTPSRRLLPTVEGDTSICCSTIHRGSWLTNWATCCESEMKVETLRRWRQKRMTTPDGAWEEAGCLAS